jgi:hypothetical protein
MKGLALDTWTSSVYVPAEAGRVQVRAPKQTIILIPSAAWLCHCNKWQDPVCRVVPSAVRRDQQAPESSENR